MREGGEEHPLRRCLRLDRRSRIPPLRAKTLCESPCGHSVHSGSPVTQSTQLWSNIPRLRWAARSCMHDSSAKTRSTCPSLYQDGRTCSRAERARCVTRTLPRRILQDGCALGAWIHRRPASRRKTLRNSSPHHQLRIPCASQVLGDLVHEPAMDEIGKSRWTDLLLTSTAGWSVTVVARRNAPRKGRRGDRGIAITMPPALDVPAEGGKKDQ